MRPANLSSNFARAWEVSNQEAPATLAAFLVHCPWAHPFWSWYLVSVITLENIPNMKPAVRTYSRAEFEFIVMALNPERPDPDPDNAETFFYLLPPNYVHQFHGVTKEQAAQCAGDFTQAIVGGLSPDTDLRTAHQQWFAAWLNRKQGES